MLKVHCSICQESFNEDSNIAALLCGHVFHDECINSWLSNKSNCPHCRKPNIGNYIKKLYFDRVCDGNLSVYDDNDSNHDFNVDMKMELQNKIQKLSIENGKLNEDKIVLIGDLQSQIKINESINKDLEMVKELQRSEYLSLSSQVFDMEKEIEKYKAQLSKLKLMNDVINKSETKILSEMSKLMNSENPKAEIDKLCSALVCCKADLDFYRENSESLSNQLSRTETENRLLQTTVEQLQSEIDSFHQCSGPSRDNFCSPDKTKINRSLMTQMDVSLSTPDNQKDKINISHILFSSPDTPGISVKNRINRELKASNPFACPNKPSENKVFDLYKLSIMRDHRNRVPIAEPSDLSWMTKREEKESKNLEKTKQRPENKENDPVKKKTKVSRSKHIQPIDRSKLKQDAKQFF